MKRLLLALLLLLVAAGTSARAQVNLRCQDVTLNATLYSQSSTGRLHAQRLTIKNLLAYFKHSDVNPRQTSVIMSGDGIYLADKSGNTFYGILLYLNSQNVVLAPQHNPLKSLDCNFLNADLAGKTIVQQKPMGKKTRMKYKMIGDGYQSGLDLILRGDLSFTISVN